MALTGLQIYKLLPKTNCKECGFPTCLAFAMKLASKQAELDSCPYVSDEARETLAAAAAPPIRLVALGEDEYKVEVGNETVMFRHEKTFFHESGLFLRVKDNEDAAEVEAKVKAAMDYTVERVGLILQLNGVAVENASGDAGTFAQCVRLVRGLTEKPLILMGESPEALRAALEQEGGKQPLLYAATVDNWEEMAALAKEAGVPLAVRADDLDTLAALTEKIKGAGVEDMVLDPGARDMLGSLHMLTHLRRLALKKNLRALGYPVITFPAEGAEDEVEESLIGVEHVAKYASLVVLDHFSPAIVYPLLTLRLNIYTDPQKPIQVSPGLYEIGTPDENSCLMVTTNFSLTYFSVAGEIEGSGRPGWLLITEAEGMSVLTAWAAGKFDAERIAKAVKQYDVASKVAHKKLVLPGYVSTLLGEVEDALPDWEIMVGPRESVDIPNYIKNVWAA
ncbi:MAG: acetyl-CoA decarbonylase/synthase complex subunit gamma [Chloroflexia bacterium]|nr:acetyl-CoA decarbonylase/synthase complex subunit gamma [Chloroflexia bacterium]